MKKELSRKTLEEKTRQTGRSSRIIAHIVDELFSVGECISTDHTVFEFGDIKQASLENFIQRVIAQVELMSSGTSKVEYQIGEVFGYKVVHFTMVSK